MNTNDDYVGYAVDVAFPHGEWVPIAAHYDRQLDALIAARKAAKAWDGLARVRAGDRVRGHVTPTGRVIDFVGTVHDEQPTLEGLQP